MGVVCKNKYIYISRSTLQNAPGVRTYVRTCCAIVAPLRVHLCACSSCNCLIDFYIALYIAWWIVGLGLSKWIVGTRHIQVLCGKYLAFYVCSCLPLSYITQQQSKLNISTAFWAAGTRGLSKRLVGTRLI